MHGPFSHTSILLRIIICWVLFAFQGGSFRLALPENAGRQTLRRALDILPPDAQAAIGHMLAAASPLWFERGKLTPSNSLNYETFGWAAAISGDTIVIGAPSEDELQGAAYVFVRPPGGWATITQAARLTASDGKLKDWFGYSVDIDGDTVIVGAPGGTESEPATIPGAAYMFVKPAAGWQDMTETARLAASDGAVNHRFGVTVAIDGSTAVAGAIWDGPGSAYLFVRQPGGWVDAAETAKLSAPRGSDEMFAMDVAIDENTLYVSALSNDSEPSRVYVYTRPVTGWIGGLAPSAELTPSEDTPDSEFGTAIAASDSTLVVGAYNGNFMDSHLGRAYIYVRPPGGWQDATETATLAASDGKQGDAFGWSVDIEANTIVVGAWGDGVGANEGQGSVYVFTRPPDGWADATETGRLIASDGAAGDSFGVAVGIAGTAIVAGAYTDVTGSTQKRGSAYVFYYNNFTQISRFPIMKNR